MTLSVAVLSPHYALVMADFRTIFVGPNAVPGPDGRTWLVPEGKRIVSDVDIRFDKIRFDEGMAEAFCLSGVHHVDQPYLRPGSPLRGFDADDHIARRFEGLADFRGYPAIARGTDCDTWGALHIFAQGRDLLATRIFAGPAMFTRHTHRNPLDKLKWVGIGSGERHAMKLLEAGELTSEWAAISSDVSVEGVARVLTFWGKVFAVASANEYDVNSVVSSWILVSGTGHWTRYGIHRFDADGALSEALYRYGESEKPIPGTWKLEDDKSL